MDPDLNQENDDELKKDSQPGMARSDNNVTKVKGVRGLLHQAKNGAKKTVKNTFNAFTEGGISKLFARVMTRKVRLLLIALLVIFFFLVIVWYVITIAPHTTLVSVVDSYVSNSTTISDEAKNTYQQTNSLLLFKNKEIKELSTGYLRDLQKKNVSLYEDVSVDNRIGDHKISSLDYTKGFEISNAYEFILNAERMNFNRVNWKKVDRETQEISELKLKKDKETNLKYPDNTEDETKDLSYFTNLVGPYLQSYVIPSSMLSGVASKSETSQITNFAFQIVDKGYHAIDVLQYTLQTAKRKREKRHYVEYKQEVKTYSKKVEVPCTKTDNAGNSYMSTCTDTIYGYSISDFNKGFEAALSLYEEKFAAGEEKSYVLSTTAKEVKKEFVYPIIKADTIKSFMRAEYEQTLYKDEDVAKFENESLSAVVNIEDYDDNDLSSKYEYGVSSSSSSWIYKGTENVTFKAGEDITTEYTWSDTLKETYTEERAYQVNDISEFVNQTDEIVEVEERELTEEEKQAGSRPDLRLEASEIFSANEISYYKELEKDNDITRIDMLNATPSIYENYLFENENYSKYIGFSRSYLSMAYTMLNKHLSSSGFISQSTTNWSSLSIGNITGLDMIWPLKYYGGISSVFGIWRPELNQFEGHSGIDITPTGDYAYPSKTAYTGSYVYAASSGKVVEILKEKPRDQGNASAKCPDTKQGANFSCDGTSNGTYGRHIKIRDDNGYTLVYAHLYEIADNIDMGSTVTQGQVLGVMGTTGSSSGVHLHFEVRQSPGDYSNAIDPLRVTSILTSREMTKKSE